MRESKVEAHLVKVIKALCGETRKAKWIGHNGAPDRLVMLPGHREIWCELKAPGKSAEAHQEREHERMRSMGCTVVVLDTIEKIDSYFLQHKVPHG